MQPVLYARMGTLVKIGIAIGLVAGAMLALCVGVIFRKDHTFRSQHIGENERMKQDGIHCATSQDREARRDKKLKIED
ncbi:MAG: hypothetical protein SPK90_05270 [Bacteroidales bacterium]|nr:hypothetical protein [Bacteroidales bacterium]MDY6405689.1 hypothetical protein [Bacteroidales bacterium]